jgi:hypothetical protein
MKKLSTLVLVFSLLGCAESHCPVPDDAGPDDCITICITEVNGVCEEYGETICPSPDFGMDH